MKEPKDVLTHYWGHDSFRSPQEAIIKAVMQEIGRMPVLYKTAAANCWTNKTTIGVCVTATIALKRPRMIKPRMLKLGCARTRFTITNINAKTSARRMPPHSHSHVQDNCNRWKQKMN